MSARADVDGVLASIDGALAGDVISSDAMRWSPDPADDPTTRIVDARDLRTTRQLEAEGWSPVGSIAAGGPLAGAGGGGGVVYTRPASSGMRGATPTMVIVDEAAAMIDRGLAPPDVAGLAPSGAGPDCECSACRMLYDGDGPITVDWLRLTYRGPSGRVISDELWHYVHSSFAERAGARRLLAAIARLGPCPLPSGWGAAYHRRRRARAHRRRSRSFR